MVWIVTWADWDGWGIVGVYDSFEKAQNVRDGESESDPDYSYRITLEEVK